MNRLSNQIPNFPCTDPPIVELYDLAVAQEKAGEAGLEAR